MELSMPTSWVPCPAKRKSLWWWCWVVEKVLAMCLIMMIGGGAIDDDMDHCLYLARSAVRSGSMLASYLPRV